MEPHDSHLVINLGPDLCTHWNQCKAGERSALVHLSVATILSSEGICLCVCLCVYLCWRTQAVCAVESLERRQRGISIRRLQLWVIFQQQQNYSSQKQNKAGKFTPRTRLPPMPRKRKRDTERGRMRDTEVEGERERGRASSAQILTRATPIVLLRRFLVALSSNKEELNSLDAASPVSHIHPITCSAH